MQHAFDRDLTQLAEYRAIGGYEPLEQARAMEPDALLDALVARRGQPRPRPPFPPIQGLYASPTQINNVQTIATIPKIIELGAEEFAKIGPQNSPGTAVFSLSGNVVNPGNYELELGST